MEEKNLKHNLEKILELEKVLNLEKNELLFGEDLFSPPRKKLTILDMAVDTEYNAREVLTVQLVIPAWNERVMIFNSRLYSRYPEKRDIIESLVPECLTSGNCTRGLFLDLEDDTARNICPILEIIVKERGFDLSSLKFNLLFYFAVNDLFPIFGFNNCIEPMLRGNDLRRSKEKLFQITNVKGLLKVPLSWGHELSFNIWDPSGLFSKQSLKKSALTCGIDLQNKDALDMYKKDMSKALLHRDRNIRNQYYNYGIDDATVLIDIKRTFLKETNKLLKNLYNFNDRFLFNFKAKIKVYLSLAIV